MSWRRDDRGDAEVPRELEVSAPGTDAAELDALEHGAEPHQGRRRALLTAAVLAAAGSLVVSVVLPHERSVQRRHAQASYDRLLALSAAGEAAVEQAVSHTRDVVQYAEPLLNSSLTSPAVRSTLFAEIAAAAQQSSSAINAERDRLAADRATRAGNLKAARAATLAYLSDWSALFAQAGGGGGALPTDELGNERRAAQVALVAAAPDPVRASKAGNVLGSDFG
ncbi:MAG: hypothetical protein QOE76_92 [Frankiales bacterium]|nr:hypothetical protein [Frankiales bacterium]